MIRVDVVRAWPRRHELVQVELADDARVRDALEASGFAGDPEISGLAVFGLRVALDTALRDRDRLELLRPLQIDPKDARRRRAAAR